jgi:hypothetical protein
MLRLDFTELYAAHSSRPRVVRLDHRLIRCALEDQLAALPSKPRAVLRELRVHNGNAVADIVALGEVPHCYEIKGECDNIRRLARQGSFYDLAFLNITLVTTANHVDRAMDVIPSHWGVMLASLASGVATLAPVRACGVSAVYDSSIALTTLWRTELAQLITEPQKKVSKLTRAELVAEIVSSTNQFKLANEISQMLAKRAYRNPNLLTM